MNVKQHRLKSPTMGVERSGTIGRMPFVVVPAGSVLTLAGEPQQSGLIDVVFEGRVIAMFFRDIQDRGEKVGVKAALPPKDRP